MAELEWAAESNILVLEWVGPTRITGPTPTFEQLLEKKIAVISGPRGPQGPQGAPGQILYSEEALPAVLDGGNF